MSGDIGRLPKWAQELIRSKNTEIGRLQEQNDALKLERTIVNQVGHVQLSGYGDVELPLGKYFRLIITEGRGANLELSRSLDGELTVSTLQGRPVALSSVSNVMHLRWVEE